MRLLFALLLLSSTLLAQTQTRVHVEHQGDDSVGIRFAFAFKETVRKSAGYVLVDERKNALNVDIATEDAWVEGVKLQAPKGSASYLSVVIFMNHPAADDCLPELVLEHKISMAGSGRVDEAAESLLARIDKILSALTKLPSQGSSASPN